MKFGELRSVEPCTVTPGAMVRPAVVLDRDLAAHDVLLAGGQEQVVGDAARQAAVAAVGGGAGRAGGSGSLHWPLVSFFRPSEGTKVKLAGARLEPAAGVIAARSAEQLKLTLAVPRVSWVGLPAR
jgi:hypothetical protein